MRGQSHCQKSHARRRRPIPEGQPNFVAWLDALSQTTKSAGIVSVRSIRNSFDITKSVVALAIPRSVEEAVNNVPFADFCDGGGVGLDQPAAELPRIWFCDDSKEPATGRLNAAQKLVRAL